MWDFRHRQQYSVPLRIEFLNIVISKNNSEQVGIVLDRIMAPSDPEVIVDQVGNLSAAKETVLFLVLSFLQTGSPFELGIMDDFVSADAILASSTSKFGIEIPRVGDEDLNSSTE